MHAVGALLTYALGATNHSGLVDASLGDPEICSGPEVIPVGSMTPSAGVSSVWILTK